MDGITVNFLVPGGPKDTPMVPAGTKMNRSLMIPPSAMAPAILWLCSSDADSMNANRYVVAKWDANASIADARAVPEAPIAWPDLAVSPVWPNTNPDTE